jgi:hypothetical protein
MTVCEIKIENSASVHDNNCGRFQRRDVEDEGGVENTGEEEDEEEEGEATDEEEEEEDEEEESDRGDKE